MGKLLFTSALALSLLLGLPANSLAQPNPYNFQLIADTNGSFESLGPFVSINTGGIVAFKADLRTGGGGVFAGSGGPITTIANTSSPPSEFGGISINAGGTVAFTGVLTTGNRGVFTGNGGPLTTIVLGSFLSFPSINNQGVVAFGTGNDIFVGSGGPPVTVATDGGAISGIGDPAINTQGTVVFAAGLSEGGQGIFTSNGGQLTLVVDTNGLFRAFQVFPVINSRGTVAFAATRNTGDDGIFTAANGLFATIVDNRGLFRGFDALSINTGGGVAFQALLDAGSEGIFTGPDPVADKVMTIGDPLLGSTVTGLAFSREGLNDMGQLAFRAALADGRQVIVRADPMSKVTIDIQPGEAPASLNPRSRGVIPVAILTTATFDATTTDPLSVKFGPHGATEAHGRGHVEDADGDGDLDLVLHFRMQDTGIQCGDTSASLIGKTFSGQAIRGADSIVTVGCR
ncbi:MAG: choice-of-anchor tandem repeat NxxGxxAF-containing protein [Caldilineaceae bacterium]